MRYLDLRNQMSMRDAYMNALRVKRASAPLLERDPHEYVYTGAGALGGGYYGHRISRYITDKLLGLSRDTSSTGGVIGKALRVAGTLGGAALGGYGGNRLYNYVDSFRK